MKQPEHTCAAEPLDRLMRAAATSAIRAALKAELDRRIKKATARIAGWAGLSTREPNPDVCTPMFLVLRWHKSDGWAPLPGRWGSDAGAREHIAGLSRSVLRRVPHVILEVLP